MWLVYDLVKKRLIPPGVFFNIIGMAHKSVMNACIGEAMDITSNGAIGLEDYLRTVGRKTGEAFRAASEIGAVIGEASKRSIVRTKIRQLVDKKRPNLLGENKKNNTMALSDYGQYLGLSFQIRDDILDVIGSEDLLGKPVYSDMIMGRSSAVLELSILEHIPREISGLKNILEESKTIEYAQDMAMGYANKAKSCLKNLDDSEYRSMLMEIADFAVNREL